MLLSTDALVRFPRNTKTWLSLDASGHQKRDILRITVLPSTDPRNDGTGIQHVINKEESACIQTLDAAVYEFIEYLTLKK